MAIFTSTLTVYKAGLEASFKLTEKEEKKFNGWFKFEISNTSLNSLITLNNFSIFAFFDNCVSSSKRNRFKKAFGDKYHDYGSWHCSICNIDE